jgi:hypothetical protein
MGIDAGFLEFMQQKVPDAFTAEYPFPAGPTHAGLDLSQIIYKRLPHESFVPWQTIRSDIMRELESQLQGCRTRFVAICCDDQELVPFAKNCERKNNRSRVAYSLEELSSAPLNILEDASAGASELPEFRFSERFLTEGIWGDAEKLMATRIVRDFITDRMLFFAKSFLEGFFQPRSDDLDRWRVLALIGIPADDFIRSSEREMVNSRNAWASVAFLNCLGMEPDLKLNQAPRCSAVCIQRRCKDGAVQRSQWKLVSYKEYPFAGEFDLQWLDFIRIARCLDRHPKFQPNLEDRRSIRLHSSDGDAIITALLHFSRPGVMASMATYDVVLDRTIHPAIGKNRALGTRFINLSALYRGLVAIGSRFPLTLAAAIAMRDMDYTDCLQNVGKETLLHPSGEFTIVDKDAPNEQENPPQRDAAARPTRRAPKRLPVSRPYLSVAELTKNATKLLNDAVRWMPDGKDIQVYTGQIEAAYVALLEQKVAPFLGVEPMPVTKSAKKLTEWRKAIKSRMQSARGFDRAKKRGDKPIRLYFPTEDGGELERALARISFSIRYYAGVLVQNAKHRMVGFGEGPASAWQLVDAPEPVNPLDMSVTAVNVGPGETLSWKTVE